MKKETDNHDSIKVNESDKSNDKSDNNSSEDIKDKLPNVKPDKKVDLFKKYKDTALEPIENKNKVMALTIESSLEFGKEQKLKDYEIEKIKLEKRLTWRNIRQFDTDESESSDSTEEEDMEDDC